MRQLKNMIQKLNENQIKTVNNAGNLAVQTLKNSGKSLNLIKYLTHHYPNAPPLQSIPEDRYIELAEGKHSFAFTLVHYFRNNLLDKHIGDFIIGVCKKADPSQNSIWIQDLSRKSFYIMSKNGQWISDKKGNQINLIVLAPLFKHAIEMLTIYNSEQNKLSKNMKLSLCDMAEYNKNNNDGDKLLDFIKSGELGKTILSYMSEHFLYYEYDEKEKEDEDIGKKPNEVIEYHEVDDKENKDGELKKNKLLDPNIKSKNTKTKITKSKNIKSKTVKPLVESEIESESDDEIQIDDEIDTIPISKKDTIHLKTKSSDPNTTIFKKNIYGSRFKYRSQDTDSYDVITDDSCDN
jgi:hypothetical protein